GRREIGTRAARQVAQGIDGAVEEKAAERRTTENLLDAKRPDEMAEVRTHLLPSARPGNLKKQAKPVDPLGHEPAIWPSPNVRRAQRQIQIAVKESLRALDVAGPTP